MMTKLKAESYSTLMSLCHFYFKFLLVYIRFSLVVILLDDIHKSCALLTF
jgi:hypothetical protein